MRERSGGGGEAGWGSLLSPALGHRGATEAAGDRGVHGVILMGHVEM